MNKEWFIFKGTHHLGPFSKEELVALFQNKEITSQTLIWKEGVSKWEALSKSDEFAFLFKSVKVTEAIPPVPKLKKEEFDLPPPLPEVPHLPSTSPKILNREGEDDDLPPPIPLDALLDPSGEVRHKVKIENKYSVLKKCFFVLSIFVFIGILGRYMATQKEAAIQLKIKGLMPVYLEKLELVATNASSQFHVAMALSLEGETLWASTNFPGDIQTLVTLNSIPKRVLGTEEVSLTVKGQLKNHIGKFSRMSLTKGSKFLPGEYSFQVVGKETHFLNRKFKSLAEIPFFQSLNKSYSYKGSTLIYSGTPREFEKRISDYQMSLLSETLKPFQDKLERIQTLESLLNATSQNYLMELERIKKGKGIQSFEQKFMKEISPLLQALVVKANELSKDSTIDEANNQFVIAPYREQVLLGKQIGEMASDMVTKTSKYNTLSVSDRHLLKAEFERKSRAIKLQIDLNAKKLEDQIQKISNP